MLSARAPDLCRGWVSGVWWGDQWEQTRQSFCPGQGVVTVGPGERRWKSEALSL